MRTPVTPAPPPSTDPAHGGMPVYDIADGSGILLENEPVDGTQLSPGLYAIDDFTDVQNNSPRVVDAIPVELVDGSYVQVGGESSVIALDITSWDTVKDSLTAQAGTFSFSESGRVLVRTTSL